MRATPSHGRWLAWFVVCVVAPAACQVSPLAPASTGSGGAAGMGVGGGAGGGTAGTAGGSGGGAGVGIGGTTGAGSGSTPDAGTGGSSCAPLRYGADDVEIDDGTAADAGAAIQACPTTDTPPSDPAALRVYHLVEPTEHARLEKVVGQYACATASIYRGSFAAQNNTPGLGDPYGVITAGPVIASLETTGPEEIVTGGTCVGWPMGRALVVFAPAQSTFVRLIQAFGDSANTTYSSPVFSTHIYSWGESVACQGCVEDLRSSSPANIAIGSATFSACGGSSAPLVTLSGQLTLVPSPSFDDILAANQPYADQVAPPSFVLQGDDMVATVSGTLFEVVDILLLLGTATPFSVDWYVNAQDFKVLGLRNFTIGSPVPICGRPNP